MSQSKKNSDKPAENPKIIGNYMIGKTIGEGTFGKVRLGIHLPTEEKVAVKILEKSKILDDADFARVSREIFILKKVRHSNVIQLYEIIETQNNIYLIMEFANKGELFDVIVQARRLKEVEASKYYRQLIDGIEYIHKLNIVHRDLKPENLLLDSNNNIKLVDFGLSNVYNTGQQLITACGSPCYAAPEMIAGKRYNGVEVDIWSSGIILFAMICGYLPFEDPDTASLYKKILKGEFSIPSFISSDAQDLMRKILITDPTKRITIQQIRAHPWFKIGKHLCKQEPFGIIPGEDEFHVNDQVLAQL